MQEHEQEEASRASLAAYRAAPAEHRAHKALEAMDTMQPLIYAKAGLAFGRLGGGRDFGCAQDLAHAWMLDIMAKEELLPDFEFLPGASLGAYVYAALLNRCREDRRRLQGTNELIPRVFISETPEGADVFQVIQSERRTQSGYFQLRQMCDVLPRYLRQIPGKVVSIHTAKGSKQTILSREHSRLLAIWLGADGEKTWQEVADELGRPRKTVTRWFDEIKAHFKSDVHPDAALLRSLMGVQRTEPAPAGDLQGRQ